ncbi:hypothetical protein JCM3765_004796 [Sporobolomyces pararoseus]
MNFFRRAVATPTVKEPPASPPPAAARLEKERKWMSTVSNKEKAGIRGPVSRDDREQARQRENSTGRNNVAEFAGEGAGNEGRMFGKWLNTSKRDERAPESSQASIRSKKSFFKSKNSQSTTTNDHQARSVPSSSSSPSPSSSSNPALSPAFASSFAPATGTESIKSSTRPETKNLATRLQELAIANADGLLDDDEYRILRQQVFETHSSRTQSNTQVESSVIKLSEGAVAVPRLNATTRSRESSIRTSAFASHPSDPSTPPTNYTETLASPVSSPLKAPSISSHQSKRHSLLPPLNSLFRRDSSSTTTVDGDWDLVTPPLSSPNEYPRSTSPLPLPYDSASVLSGRSHRPTLSPPTSPMRNRSIRNHAGLSSSALDSRPSSYLNGGSRSSNGRTYAGIGGGGDSVFSAGSRSNGHAPRSPTSVRTRSYYGGGGGGPSSSLSHGYSSNYSHDRGSGVETLLSHSLPPITSSTDPLLFAATSREPSAEELANEIKEIEVEWERMRESWREIARKRVEVWENQVGGTVVREARQSAAQETAQASTEQNGFGTAGGTVAGKKGLFKRASFLPSSQSSTSSSAILNSRPPTHSTSHLELPQFLLSSKTPLPPDFQSKLSPHLFEPTMSFRFAMEDLLDRQRRTEEKYERRLEFLRAKEKGARIKQGLLA